MEKISNSENSDSNQDPLPSLPTSSTQKSKNQEHEEDDPETTRESKRRKNCPTALESIQEFTPPNPNFSFSFDTKFAAASPPEFTPKFGSFNMVLPTKEQDSGCLQSLQDEVTTKDTAEDEDGEEVNCSTLRSVDDGIKETE